ncbi:type II toxin-antitoxin system VapC family toxin [Gordonia sp. PKS22-38]|uniref:Ribonuclease VapC n=1 Tax=Gordonia prachuapensis TaxID=3115651 RepID=A0ABU7MUC9_9ACTN|nr:type II toxin-antitoxin system VapC family toxin [Gordonia sp. PKS22-38]
MVVDTSAIIAIIVQESDARVYAEALALHHPLMAVPTYLECCIVADAKRIPVASRKLDRILEENGVEVVDTDKAQGDIARQAFRDFGKGMGHPAQLNFGDCFSYALAIHRNLPLLWKGDDFMHTGVRSALLEIQDSRSG